MTARLSIAIPSYNRPRVLQENLEAMLPELLETGTPVFISDDSSDDRVQQVVEAFQGRCSITYEHNRPGLGHDANCLHTLRMANTEYVWYLGDSMRILPGGLKRVLDCIRTQAPDVLAVTQKIRGRINLPTGLYPDHVQVLEQLAWHLTLTGASVYRREVLDLDTYEQFLGSNFMQLGILLQNLPNAGKGLYWLNEVWVEAHPDKSSYWEKSTIKVFAGDWSEFIMGLGEAYPMPAKLEAAHSHSRQTGILEWKALKRLRRLRILTFDDYRRFKAQLALTSDVPLPLIAALCCLPPAILAFMHRPFGGSKHPR